MNRKIKNQTERKEEDSNMDDKTKKQEKVQSSGGGKQVAEIVTNVVEENGKAITGTPVPTVSSNQVLVVDNTSTVPSELVKQIYASIPRENVQLLEVISTLIANTGNENLVKQITSTEARTSFHGTLSKAPETVCSRDEPPKLDIQKRPDQAEAGINRITPMKYSEIKLRESDVRLNIDGIVSEGAIFREHRVGFTPGVYKKSFSITDSKVPLDIFIKLPKVVEEIPRIMDFVAINFGDVKEMPTTFSTKDALLELIGRLAKPILAGPVLLLTLELSDEVMKSLSRFNKIGKFVCKMPFSELVVIESPLKLDVSSNASTAGTGQDLTVLNLVSGALYMAFDLALMYQVIIKRTGKFKCNVSGPFPGTNAHVVNSIFLGKYFNHPAFIEAIGAASGSLKTSIQMGVDMYGAMPIGEERIIESINGNATKTLDWDYIDQLTAKLLASTFEYVNRGEINISRLVDGVTAHLYTKGYIERIPSYRDGRPIFFPIDNKREISDIMYALGIDDTVKETLFTINYTTLTAFQIIHEDLNKQTYLSDLIKGFSQNQLQGIGFSVFQDLFSFGTVKDLLSMITFLFSSEFVDLYVRIPLLPGRLECLYVLYATMLFILFFPKLAKWSMAHIHCLLFHYLELCGEATELLNFKTIRIGDQEGNEWPDSRVHDPVVWRENRLISMFFSKKIDTIQRAKHTKRLCNILRQIIGPYDLVQDSKAQKAGFPRVYTTSSNNSTNGGLYVPWDTSRGRKDDSQLKTKIQIITNYICDELQHSGLTKTVSGTVTQMMRASCSDLCNSAEMITYLIAPLFNNMVNAKVNILYLWDGSFITPINSNLVMYDKQRPQEYLYIFGMVEPKEFGIFSIILTLSQKMLIAGESTLDQLRDNKFTVTILDPLENFMLNQEPFFHARGIGDALGLSRVISTLILDRGDNPISRILDSLNYDKHQGTSTFQSVVDNVAYMMGEKIDVKNSSLNQLLGSGVNDDRYRKMLVRMIHPELGTLNHHTPIPFLGRLTPPADLLFHVSNTLLVQQINLIIETLLSPKSPLCKFSKGIYISNLLTDNLSFTERYIPTGNEVLLTDPLQFCRTTRIHNGYMIVFVYNGIEYRDPSTYPLITFTINGNLVMPARAESIFANGFRAKRFSFYLPNLHYVWEFGRDYVNQTLKVFEDYITYNIRYVYHMVIVQYIDLLYQSNDVFYHSVQRLFLPVDDIFSCLLGTGFNTISQMPGGIPFDYETMESGVELNEVYTGIENDEMDAIVQKPVTSKSMVNLVPSVTSIAELNLNEWIKFIAFAQEW